MKNNGGIMTNYEINKQKILEDYYLCIGAFENCKLLYNELAKLQTEYNTNKNNKNLTESQMAQIRKEINNINASIVKIREEIKQAEKDIEQSKKDIDSKKVETDGLIQL